MLRPGPKPLPYTARRVERVILNLYPATAESLCALAFDIGQTPRQVAEHALYIGLAQLIAASNADADTATLDQKSA